MIHWKQCSSSRKIKKMGRLETPERYGIVEDLELEWKEKNGSVVFAQTGDYLGQR